MRLSWGNFFIVTIMAIFEIFNWNLDVFAGFAGAGAVLIGFILFYRWYWQRRYQYLLSGSLICAVVSLHYFALGLSTLLTSTDLSIYSSLFLLACFPIAVVWYDTLTYEHLGTWKMVVACSLTVAGSFFAFMPGAFVKVFYPDGSQGITWSGNLVIIGTLQSILFIICIMTPLMRIYHYAPRELKRPAMVFPIALVIICIDVAHTTVSDIIPLPGFESSIEILWTIMILWTFARHPQLAFVLPFKVSRVTVLNAKSGIPIFDHVWSKQGQVMAEPLFGSVLQGVSTILRESVGKGNVEEVRMHGAILIIKNDEKRHLAFVLLANAISKTLRQALDYFSNRFIELYGNLDFDTGYISQFEGANDVVKESFSFIPD